LPQWALLSSEAIATRVRSGQRASG